ncbi:MAG: hypothetical protein MRERV_35c014 [Mycoplasmataceae bacterium RV_VA103A]|nr:MAG: hypothetical protein MRERV_35c014 [Mycoplasmataceae bacterium RV_VA103A]
MSDENLNTFRKGQNPRLLEKLKKILIDIENKNEGSSDKKTISHLESALIKEIQKILLNTNQEIGGGTSEEIFNKNDFQKIQENLREQGFNDLYHFLGVDKNIENEELRRVCKQKLLEYKKASSIKADEKTKALFQLATETKKILVENEGKDRQQYNNWLSGNGSSSSSSSTSHFSGTSASSFYSSSFSFESLSAEIEIELTRYGVKTEELMDYFGLGKMSSGLDYTNWKEKLRSKGHSDRRIYVDRLKNLIANISARKSHMKDIWEKISAAEQRARVFLGPEIKVTYREGMMVMGESCGLKELQTILDSALQNISALEKQKKEEEIKIRLEERRIKEFEREKVRLTSYFNKCGAQIVKKDKWTNQWMAIFTSIENAVDEASLENIEQNTIPNFLFDQAKKRIQKELGKHYDEEKDCPENDRENIFKNVEFFIGRAKNRVKKAATEEIDNVLDELNKIENLSISLNRDFVEEIWGAENLEQVDNLYELASTEIKKEVIIFYKLK